MTEKTKQLIIEAIRTPWQAYNRASVLSVLKGGAWTHTPLVNGTKPPSHIDGVRAEKRPLKAVMGFPEYLETIWKTKR